MRQHMQQAASSYYGQPPEVAPPKASPKVLVAKTQRDGAVVLDTDATGSLIRLLSLPHTFNPNFLFKVFFHLCANSRTRSFIMGSLISLAAHASRFPCRNAAINIIRAIISDSLCISLNQTYSCSYQNQKRQS